MLIYSTGAVTAVGLNALQTSAAVRARQSGIEASIEQAPPDEPLSAAAVPAGRDLRQSAGGWLARLLRRALKECLGGYTGAPERLGLFVALPESFRGHEVTSDDNGRAFLARALRPLGWLPSAHSGVLTGGRAAAAPALLHAQELLRRHDIDAALVGGVDSLLGEADRTRLRDAGRLYEPGQPFGAIPGEGAAFVLVGIDDGPFAGPPLARLLGIGQALEPDHAGTDRYATGVGLQQAIDQALADAQLGEGAIRFRITDLNGERHRTWESSVLAARLYREWRDGLPCMHVPAFTGDVGAATLPLQLVLAAHALHRGHAAGAPLVCETASDLGLRGACLLDAAPGAPAPPFRSGRGRLQRPAGADAAVVVRQVERLPDELAWLAAHRRRLAGGRLPFDRLDDWDERLDALLSLAAVCGAPARRALLDGIETAGAQAWFAPTVLALEDGDPDRLFDLLPRALAGPEPAPGVEQALHWVSPRHLKGITPRLLGSPLPHARRLLAASLHAHRVPPGGLAAALLADADPRVRALTLRALADAGSVDERQRALDALHDPDPHVRHEAARAALLLGERDAGLAAMRRALLDGSPDARRSRWLYLAAAGAEACRQVLRELFHAARDLADRRELLRACAAAGDPHQVPWLIRQMSEPALARLAGECFAWITGADLPAEGLTRPAPAAGAPGPNDDPADPRVDPDEDADLPWPDPARVAAWWKDHGAGLPPGVRHVLGHAPALPRLLTVLQHGRQHQRRAAALQICLLQPGGVLFDTAAPAWRQRRRLGGGA